MDIKKSNQGGRRPGAGRPKGRPNKITAEIKTLAQHHGEQAIALLAQMMMESDSDQAKIAAAKELLDRGYGKATQLVGGDSDKPLKVEVAVGLVSAKH